MGGINPVPGAIGGNSELDAPGVPSLVGMGFLTKASHNVPKPFSMASMVRFWPDLSSSKTVLSPPSLRSWRLTFSPPLTSEKYDSRLLDL